MTQTRSRKLTFDEFLEQYPDGQGIYELVDGEVVEMRATREHDDINMTSLWRRYYFSS